MKKVCILAALAVLASSSHAIAFLDLVKDGNTGIDGTAVIAAGTVDDDWVEVTNPDGNAIAVANVATGWKNNSGVSGWLAVQKSGSPLTAQSGDYLIKLGFVVPEYDKSLKLLTLSGSFLSDNAASLRLDAVSTPFASGNSSSTWTSFTLTNLTPGAHTLGFAVNNSTASPVGFRLEFTKAAIEPLSVPAVPEPVTLGLLTAGLGAAFLKRRSSK